MPFGAKSQRRAGWRQRVGFSYYKISWQTVFVTDQLVSLSLSLSLSHTHTPIHPYTHTHTLSCPFPPFWLLLIILCYLVHPFRCPDGCRDQIFEVAFGFSIRSSKSSSSIRLAICISFYGWDKMRVIQFVRNPIYRTKLLKTTTTTEIEQHLNLSLRLGTSFSDISLTLLQL